MTTKVGLLSSAAPAAAPVPPAGDDPTSEPLTITIRRTRELTGLSTATIYREIANGNFEALKFGRSTLLTYPSVKHRMTSLPRAAIKPAT
jgi:hypothetical protein